MEGKETKFGQFLKSLRIERGFTNISQYLQQYQVNSISAAYYRDLESGRKQVSFETAADLCGSLQVDSKRLYYHLLSDVLPEDVMKHLVRPIIDETFSNVEERIKKLEEDRATYRSAFEKSWLSEILVPGEDIVTYLVEHSELMPLIHFLFNTDCTNEFELAEVMTRNGINLPVEQVIDDLSKKGLIVISRAETGNAEFKIRRRLRQLAMPSPRLIASDIGIGLARQYRQLSLTHELQKSFSASLPLLKEPLLEHGTYIYSGVSATSRDCQSRIWSRIRDLIAEMHADSLPIDSGGKPYYCAILFSSRPEYAPAK